MAISKYTRFGLRADKNLSDLTNKSKALENILDDFTPGQVFTSADLTVINGLKTTNLYATDLAPLANTEVLYTPITLDENNNYTVGVPEPVEPIVTVKDLIQTKRVVLGDPPYHLGGSGPNAFVVPPEALNANAAKYFEAEAGGTHANITADDIYDTTNASGLILTGEDYWIDGRFAFNGPFHPTFSSPFGALSWDGYFSGYENPYFQIITNGFLLLEIYDEQTNAWVTKKRLSAQGSNVLEGVALMYDGTFSNQTTGIPLTETAKTLAWEGMKISQSDGSVYEITNVNHDNNTMSVSKISGSGTGLSSDDSVFGTGGALASWLIGENDLRIREFRFLPYKVKGQTTRVRLTVWYPKPETFPPTASTQMADVSSFGPFKLFFDRNDGFNGDVATPFNWWYKTNQLAPDSEAKINTFDHFKRNRISPRKKITTEYVQNEQPVYINYEPSLDIADYFKDGNSDAYVTPATFTWQGGNAYTTTANYIEVGDILLPKAEGTDQYNGIFLQVYEIQDGGTRILTEPFKGPLSEELATIYLDGMSAGDSFDAYVLKSKGLLGLFVVDGTAGTGGYSGSTSGDLTVNLYESSNALYTNTGYVGQTGGTGSNIGATFKDYQYNANDIRQNDLVIIMEGSSEFLSLTNDRATDTTKVRRISSVPVVSDTSTTATAGDGSNLEGLQTVQFNCKHTGTHEPFTQQGWVWVAVYSHRGLSDHSISAQCVGVYGKEVTATLVGGSGANTVTLTDTNEITDGDYIQFDGLGGPSDQVIPQGTTVTVQNATQIQLSNDIPTGKSLNAASTVVFIKAANYTAEGVAGSGDNNKEICIIPLNTAPPFAGTDLGLSTVSTHPHLSVGGDFEITGINIEQATTTEVGSPTSATANKGLLLKEKTGASTYKDYWILMD
jgi:hypothetical protein